jgi:hypothetical protein
VFPKILAQNCEDFNQTNTLYNADSRKNGCVRRHMTSYLTDEVGHDISNRQRIEQ